MEIAVVLNAHSHSDVIVDTLHSIFDYVSEKVLVVVDGMAWDKFNKIDLPAMKVEGFRHGAPRSPYRNVALGLSLIVEKWPQADWYLYTEYDVLFGSDRYRHNLEMSQNRNVWMMGNDGHVDDMPMPLLESLVEGKLSPCCYYLLGCCQFFSKRYLERLNEINFFERFLSLTNSFPDGHFPKYSGYDISEHMYPTLARYLGGNIGVFATWDQGQWHGASKYFPVRWQPELNSEVEEYEDASIMHPLKSYDHPIREFHRERRREKHEYIMRHDGM